VRLRLTLLYSGLFVLAGAVLLAIVYVLVAGRVASSAQVVKVPGDALIFRVQSGGSANPGTAPLPLPVPLPGKAGGVGLIAPSGKALVTVPEYLPLANARRKLDQAIATERADERSRLLLWSGIALGVMAVVSGVLGWLMAGRALAPLRTMTARARLISERNLHERLALAGPDDELKELGDTFDGVLDRLQGAFEAQRRFVANASHELRTPLTLERTTVEVALADPDADARSLRDACESVLVANEQQERLIEGLLTLARSHRGLERDEPLDLAGLAATALAALGGTRRLRIEVALDPAPAPGDARLLERLVANLLDNAVRHNIAGGWIAVTTGLRDGRVTMTVANSGRVIAAEELPGLLEPFRRGGADRTVTTDGHGHGLGLSIVTAIADAHGADLGMRALPGGGLEVSLAYPPDPAAAPASSSARTQSHSDDRSSTPIAAATFSDIP
jgi:signal transduction histidine kinase